MKRLLKRGLATAMALSLMMAFATFNAGAVSYTATGGTTTIPVHLVVDDDANIPELEFSFTIVRCARVAPTSSTMEILYNENSGSSIGNATFTSNDTSTAQMGLPSDTTGTTTTGKKYATKNVTITFPDGIFTKPGIYRYEIAQTANTTPGVVNDAVSPRYLDVFVVADNANKLSVSAYVLRNTATNIGTNGKYVTNPDEKSAGYTNSITHHDFSFSKTIAGNQGDKGKLFTFTLYITGAIPGTYTVNATDVTGDTTSVIIHSGGTFERQFDLTDGSSFKVLNLNEGAVCKVTEDAQDYTPSHVVDSGSPVGTSDSGNITMNADHTVAFTNTKNGAIPTGVLLTVTPFAVGLLLFGALAFFMMARSRRGY